MKEKMEQEKEKKKQPFGGMELSERMRRGLKRGGIEWVTIELEKENKILWEKILIWLRDWKAYLRTKKPLSSRR